MNLKHEQKIILIITDAVIFHRLAQKITDIMNIVIDPDFKDQFHANECYNGFNTAIEFLEMEPEDKYQFEDILLEIATQITNEKEKPPYIAAEEIYSKWIQRLKKLEYTSNFL